MTIYAPLASAIILLATSVQAAVNSPFTTEFEAGERGPWKIIQGDWQFVPGAVRQASADYDCIAGLPLETQGPVYVSIRFEPTGGFNGGGLVFGMTAPDDIGGGTLVRCDPGGRVLWGQFSRGGTFEYGGDVHIPDVAGEQELAIAFDPAKLAFNVYHDGQRVATNLMSSSPDGYVAMQTSGGAHRITAFTVRPARSDELAGLTAPSLFSRVVDAQGNPRQVTILRNAPELLVSLDRNGEILNRFEAEALPKWPGRSLGPVALAEGPQAGPDAPGYLYALLGDGTTIYRFSEDLAVVGDGPVIHQPEMQGAGLAVDSAGRFYVTDPSIPGVRVFSADGNQLLAFGESGGVNAYDRPDPAGSGKFKQPRGIAVRDDGLIVVTDRENLTYVLYRYDAESSMLKWVNNGPWLPMPDHVQFTNDGNLLLAGTHEYYRAAGALRVLSVAGRSLNVFLGHALGDMSDKVIATQGPGDRFFVIDPAMDRTLVLPVNFVEEMPKFGWLEGGGVKLTMTQVDGSVVTSINTETSEEHDDRIVVRQPEPICPVWPAEHANLETYYLPPKPPAGKKYVIDMPVLVAVIARARIDSEVVELDADPNAVIARLEDELAPDRQFYWINSHAILNKQFSYMVIDEEIGPVDGGWITPSNGRQLVNRARVQRGLEPISSDHSLVVIHATDDFDPEIRDDLGMVSGGGFTTFGYSGYALWNHGQSWLMAHEWGHQLDSYFAGSGMGDWWLNHPDATVHVGRYGEHWDCNAFLCRRVDPMNWLRFDYGTLRLTADADGDGLPDEDPALPLDEARFGSSAELIDTDNDGLTDLEELMAGTFTSSDPQKMDTDGDGVIDGQDAYPQFAIGTTIALTKPGANGAAPTNGFKPLGTIAGDFAAADVLAAFDADNLYLRFKMEALVPQVHATVDFNHDGWFAGRDNVYARSWFSGGMPDRDQFRVANAEGQLREVDGIYVIDLSIPRPPTVAPLQPGRTIGLTVRLQGAGGDVAFLIDPWALLSLQLQ
jgi:hypothetical protein